MSTRRPRSKRAKSEDYVPPKRERELPRTWDAPIRHDTHPSSVEFLAAYNGYWDAVIQRGDDPLAPAFWRAAALAVVR